MEKKKTKQHNMKDIYGRALTPNEHKRRMRLAKKKGIDLQVNPGGITLEEIEAVVRFTMKDIYGRSLTRAEVGRRAYLAKKKGVDLHDNPGGITLEEIEAAERRPARFSESESSHRRRLAKIAGIDGFKIGVDKYDDIPTEDIEEMARANGYGKKKTKADMEEIRKRALEHVKSVSYPVGLRWLFYRLLQDGFYTKKEDYVNSFKVSVSNWRHNQLDGWHPNTLVDESREIIPGDVFIGDDIQDVVNSWATGLDVDLRDSIFMDENQEYYVEAWFEARAMTGQFREYTEYITLVPFGGETSIPQKWAMAKNLEDMWRRFHKPIVILYFGDCDEYGESIQDNGIDGPKGVRKWCDVDFKVVRCGLNEDQAIKYGIPENPDKPGQYQWEALEDWHAKEIIIKNIEQWVDYTAYDRMAEKAKEEAAEYIERLAETFDEMDIATEDE